MNTNDKFKSLEPLLEIKNLKVQFPSRKKMLTAVDGVNLTIKPGEIVGVVGESGSGKSVMSQSILRLREYDSAVKYEGEILFEGKISCSLASPKCGQFVVTASVLSSKIQ